MAQFDKTTGERLDPPTPKKTETEAPDKAPPKAVVDTAKKR